MSKLNRKEFKDLLLEWNKNFVKKTILERGLSSNKIKDIQTHIQTKRVDFNSLRDKSPVILPIMYIMVNTRLISYIFRR